MKSILVFFTVIFSFNLLNSQSLSEYNQIYREIEKNFEEKDYLSAINNYNKLNYLGYRHFYICHDRALCYMYLGEEEKAIEEFRKARLMGDTTFLARFLTDKEFMLKELSEGYVDDTATLLPEYNYYTMPTRADSLMGNLSEMRKKVDVKFYDLTVKVLPEIKEISGKNDIYFEVTDPVNEMQIDLKSDYIISSLKMDGYEVEYKRDCNAIFIRFNKMLDKSKLYKLSIVYNGKPIEAKNPPWNGGFTWMKLNKSKTPNHIGVSCEHLGASSWWPLKDHLSDKPDSMAISIIVPQEMEGVSNGVLRKVTDMNDGYKKFDWFVSYPINSYNVTLYAGNFYHFSDTLRTSEYSYPVDYYVTEKNKKVSKKYYANTLGVLRIFESLYGPYPYIKDGAGFVEAPFAGMEHQGAIAIGDSYYKDRDYDLHPDSFPHLLIHETAHEWWGNTVAFGDMADAWISETFATYSEALLYERAYNYEEYMNLISLMGSEIINARPLVGERNINLCSFITGDIYFKGAIMLHNFRCLIDNDTLFFSIIKDFYNVYKYKVIYTEDFLDFIYKRTGKRYKEFFEKFLYDSTPPKLCYSGANYGNDFFFTYYWKDVNPGFEMPFCVYINGKPLRLMATCKPQTYHVNGNGVFYIPTFYNYNPKSLLPNSLTYFWCRRSDPVFINNRNREGGEIEKGVSLLGLKQGRFETYDNSVRKTKEVNYFNGKLNGLTVSYDTTGAILEEAYYSEDKLNGVYKKYFNNLISVKGEYTDGIKSGKWDYYKPNGNVYLSASVTDSAGYYFDCILFNNDGKKVGEGKLYKNTQIRDSWKYYDNKGKEIFDLDTCIVCNDPALFPGGDVEMYKAIRSNSFSAIFNENDLPGKNWVSVVINPNGTVGEVLPVKCSSINYTKSIISAIDRLPLWIPALIDGKPAYYKVVLMFNYIKKTSNLFCFTDNVLL